MAGFAAQQLLHLTLHRRHPGAAAHQQHLAQLAGRNACVPQRILHGSHCAGQQVAGHHFELRAGKRDIQVVRAVLAHCDKGQVQLCRRRCGKLLLCLFGFLFQPAHSRRLAGEVDAIRFFELGHGIFHDALIEVVTAQMGVAAGGKHRKGPVLDLDDGHIKGAAAEVVDEDLLRRFVIQTIGHSGSSRLVDDAQHVQACNAACILRSLALAVVEVGGHRDDRFGHRLAQIALGIAADLGQNHGADLLRGQVFAVDMHPVVTAHMALDTGDGAPGICGDLALGRTAHQTFTVLREGYNAGGGALTLRIGDDHGLAALHHCHAGIGRAEIDADYFAHTVCFLSGAVHLGRSSSNHFRVYLTVPI